MALMVQGEHSSLPWAGALHPSLSFGSTLVLVLGTWKALGKHLLHEWKRRCLSDVPLQRIVVPGARLQPRIPSDFLVSFHTLFWVKQTGPYDVSLRNGISLSASGVASRSHARPGQFSVIKIEASSPDIPSVSCTSCLYSFIRGDDPSWGLPISWAVVALLVWSPGSRRRSRHPQDQECISLVGFGVNCVWTMLYVHCRDL